LKYTKGALPNRYGSRYEIPKHAEWTGKKVLAKLAPVKGGDNWFFHVEISEEDGTQSEPPALTVSYRTRRL
jgi:hypothetical protein